MSHLIQISTQVRDAAAVRAGCARLGLDHPVEGEVKLFSETVSGLAVQLQQWQYPVVFNLATGETKFDNYQGHWVVGESRNGSMSFCRRMPWSGRRWRLGRMAIRLPSKCSKMEPSS